MHLTRKSEDFEVNLGGVWSKFREVWRLSWSSLKLIYEDSLCSVRCKKDLNLEQLNVREQQLTECLNILKAFLEYPWCLSYQSTGDALWNGVISLVELLHFGSHLGLAVLTPGRHELLGQSSHLLHLPSRQLQLGTQHLQDTHKHTQNQWQLIKETQLVRLGQ